MWVSLLIIFYCLSYFWIVKFSFFVTVGWFSQQQKKATEHKAILNYSVNKKLMVENVWKKRPTRATWMAATQRNVGQAACRGRPWGGRQRDGWRWMDAEMKTMKTADSLKNDEGSIWESWDGMRRWRGGGVQPRKLWLESLRPSSIIITLVQFQSDPPAERLLCLFLGFTLLFLLWRLASWAKNNYAVIQIWPAGQSLTPTLETFTLTRSRISPGVLLPGALSPAQRCSNLLHCTFMRCFFSIHRCCWCHWWLTAAIFVWLES